MIDCFLKMSNFERKKYVPNELISNCGDKLDFHHFTNGLDWQELLDKSSDEIENYKEALERIRVAETKVMEFQKCKTRDIFKNNNFEYKCWSLSLDFDMRNKYGLLQMEDILNKDKIALNNLPNKCETASTISTELKLEKIIKLPDKSDIEIKESLAKSAYIKIIMVAEPKNLEFHNYKLKKSYKKIILLKNISFNLARFQLDKRPNNSKFLVFLDSEKGTIAPGMSAKIIVIFCSNSFEEPQEEIIVKVQGGRPIVIHIRAFRDPPILHGISTLYHSCFRSNSINTPSTDSINTTLVESEIWTGDEVSRKTIKEFSTTDSSEYDSLLSEKISTTYFECGKCFIGELVIIPTTLKNAGENGRFFIMSEVDWSSLNIEDVAYSNFVIIPPFAVHPAYFILPYNEEITFHSYFFPTTYGMQVDKFFIVSDNCSVQPLEIIGDGIIFEEKFILFNELMQREFLYENCEDKFAKYCVELNIRNSGGVHNCIEILNTSGLMLNYRWEQRELEAKNGKNEEKSWENLSLDDIIIFPLLGVFKPYSTTKFYIFTRTETLVSDQYRTILQLCIEDIPLASIPKRLNLRLRDSITKRRMCQIAVDIFIFDIEVLIQNNFSDSTSTEKILNFDKSIQTEEDFIILSPVTEKEYKRKPKTICCMERKCNVCTESMASIKAIIEFQNPKNAQSINCKLLKTEFNIAILKLARHLYVGMKETFLLILRNLSNQRMIFEWGEVSGEDENKLKVSIDPIRGSICGKNIKKIQVSCEPLEPGIVSSFSIPCCSVKMENSLTLKIECVIESLSVSFLFSTKNVDVWLPSEELICVKWNTNSDINTPDRKIIKYSDILSSVEREKSTDGFELCESEFYEDFSELMISKEFFSQSDSQALILFQKKKSLPTKEPIIQFLKLPLRVAEMRIFLIQNNSPLVSKYLISSRNLDFNNVENAEFNGDNWDKIKQSGLEIVLITKPCEGELKPFDIKTIEVYAYANIWGYYEEEIDIKIDGLPQFTVKVEIQVEDLPILYPACRNLFNKIPFLKFMKHEINSTSRNLAVENTSSMPIIINWHSFLIKNDSNLESIPFKIFIDILPTFSTFDFPERSDCEKNIENLFKTSSEKYKSNQISKEFNGFDSITKKNDVEIKLFLIPNCDKFDDKIFSIHPSELLIPPRAKRFVTVKLNLEAPLEYSTNIFCHALGFIRIASENKKVIDGHRLPPTIINLEVVNVRPYLSLLSSKSQKIFKCFANIIGHHSKQEKIIQRKLLFKNENQEVMDVNFETSKPFFINGITTYCGTKLSSRLCIQPGESIEVVIVSSVNDKEIQELIKENKRNNDWLKTIIRNLRIIYYDGWIQEIELCLQIYLPLLKLSTKDLNFYRVYVGSSKELFLNIENFAVWDQAFQIKTKNKESEFSILPTKGLLYSNNSNAGRSLKISITFKPVKDKISSEILEIITGIPGYILNVQLHGTGVSDNGDEIILNV